jgi:hypothetical protein
MLMPWPTPLAWAVGNKDGGIMKQFNVLMIAVLWTTMVFGLGVGNAMDDNGRFYALGMGKRPCGDFVKFREKRLENFTAEQYEVAGEIIKHWVAGFLTAHNFYVSDTYNVMGNATIDEVASWLESYCKTNEKKYFAEAALELTRAYHSKRVKMDTAHKK